MAAPRLKDNNGDLIAEYQYDPFGRRVSKTVYAPPGQNPETTWYVYSDQGLMAELDETGQETDFYLFAPDGLWSTDPILRKSGSSYYYYQTDHLGTPQQLVDGAGAAVHSREMRAFGEVAATGIEDQWRFAGQLKSQETGLYHNYFRDYEPLTGRYVQSDPFGLQGGMNMHGYAAQDPVHSMDPMGLFDEDIGLTNKAMRRGSALDRLGDIFCFLISYGNRRKLDDIYWRLSEIERQLDDCERLCYTIWFEVTRFIKRECITDAFFHVGHCPPADGLHSSLNNSVRTKKVEQGELKNEERVCWA